METPILMYGLTGAEWAAFQSMMGCTPPERHQLVPSPPETWVTRPLLFSKAKTFRERVFARQFFQLVHDPKLDCQSIKFDHITPWFNIVPHSFHLRYLMGATRANRPAFLSLSRLKIRIPPRDSSSVDELPLALQDLADMIAGETTAAFNDSYYPRPVDIDPLTDEHVEQVMRGMQRELTSEFSQRPRGNLTVAELLSLPIERQRSLAERRRKWFAFFGITPKGWRAGVWSLWKIPNVPITDYDFDWSNSLS